MAEEMDADRAAIREEISKMSIEEVLALKEKIGTKLFDKSMGLDRPKSFKDKYKRENKNRPRMEPIAKRPVKRLKDVVGTKAEHKRDVRDPRFDPMCGDYDEKVKNREKMLNFTRLFFDIFQKIRKNSQFLFQFQGFISNKKL